MSAQDDGYLFCITATDFKASSQQFAERWCTARSVSLTAPTIRQRLLHRELNARVPLNKIPLTQNHRRLRLQRVQPHRHWRGDPQQFVFSDISRFYLRYSDGRIRLRSYSSQQHLPRCVIQRLTRQTPSVMVWGAIGYHG